MGLLPLPHVSRLLGIPEVILVLGFGEPGLLAVPAARLAALGFGTEALACATAVIGNKLFVAVEAIAAAFRSLHQFPKSEEPISGRSPPQRKKIPSEEDPERRRRKKNRQRMAGRKRTEEDPISHRPFWASFISPLASGIKEGADWPLK